MTRIHLLADLLADWTHNLGNPNIALYNVVIE